MGSGEGSGLLAKVNEPRRVYLLADDLTGACDAAAPFAARAVESQVLLDPLFAGSSAPVQSLCMASRDVSADAAAASLRAVAADLRAGLAADRDAELFKKIDSVFRGNTLVEIATTLAAFPDHLGIIAPAFPDQGRLCSDDHLHICDAAGRRTFPLREAFAAAGLHPEWLPPGSGFGGVQSAMRKGGALFCEATNQQQLGDIVAAGRSLARPILWIGSAGLAHALAESLYPGAPQRQVKRPGGGLLVLTGSDHAVTHNQLAAVADLKPPILRIERNRTPLPQIEAFVSAHPGVSLLLNGGDTALQVCRALSIHSLCVQGEYASGIPLARAKGGAREGTWMVLKSGGFGGVTLLREMVRDFSS